MGFDDGFADCEDGNGEALKGDRDSKRSFGHNTLMSENEPTLPPDEIPFARAVIPALPPVAPNAPAQYAQGYAPQSGYGIPPDYMTGGYVNTAKPGVVTAIGVLSIVLGAFSIIGSGVAAFQVLVQSIMVQSSAVLTRSMAAKAAQQSAVHLPPAGAMGLEFDERQTAINVLASRQSLTLDHVAASWQLNGSQQNWDTTDSEDSLNNEFRLVNVNGVVSANA